MRMTCRNVDVIDVIDYKDLILISENTDER